MSPSVLGRDLKFSVAGSRFLWGRAMVDRYTVWADWTGWTDE